MGCQAAGACCPDNFVGYCLTDGTPISLVVQGSLLTGWINLLTGIFTPGAPPAGTQTCVQPFSIDSENNYIYTDSQIPTLPFLANEEFTGSEWVPVQSVGSYIFLLLSQFDFDTVELEWSDDGVNPNGAVTTLTADTLEFGPFTFFVYLTISNIISSGYYFRSHIINGPTDQDFSMVGIALTGKFPFQPLIGIDDDLPVILQASITRSVLAGKKPGGEFENVGLSQSNALRVYNESIDIDHSGAQMNTTRYNQTEVAFFDGVPSSDIITTSVSGGGTIVASAGHGLIQTGVAASAAASFDTVKLLEYQHGFGSYVWGSAAFTLPTDASSFQRWGLYDDNDGFFIGYEGLTFGFTRRRGGVDTFVPRSAWSVDPATGAAGSEFVRSGIPEVFDPQDMNSFRIRFGSWDAGIVNVEIFSPDGVWTTVHQIKQPNTELPATIETPKLPIRVQVSKTVSDATNIKIETGYLAIGTGSNLENLSDSVTDDSLAELVRAVLTGRTPSGTYVNLTSDSDGALQVAVANASTVSAPAQTATGAAAIVLAANAARKSFSIQNTGTVVVKFTYGGTNPTATAYHFALSPGIVADDGNGGYFVDDQWTGDVRAFSSVAGTIVITELT